MNTVTLTVKKVPDLYLECQNVTPDAFAGKTADQITKLEGYQGKEIANLGDYFTIAGKAGATAADTRIVINGDCTKMKYIGSKMSAGEVVVNSSCDMYIGSWMTGGRNCVRRSRRWPRRSVELERRKRRSRACEPGCPSWPACGGNRTTPVCAR